LGGAAYYSPPCNLREISKYIYLFQTFQFLSSNVILLHLQLTKPPLHAPLPCASRPLAATAACLHAPRPLLAAAAVAHCVAPARRGFQRHRPSLKEPAAAAILDHVPAVASVQLTTKRQTKRPPPRVETSTVEPQCSCARRLALPFWPP
jgi:hypothetical protein